MLKGVHKTAIKICNEKHLEKTAILLGCIFSNFSLNEHYRQVSVD